LLVIGVGAFGETPWLCVDTSGGRELGRLDTEVARFFVNGLELFRLVSEDEGGETAANGGVIKSVDVELPLIL
jgi:hypothetical protein